MFIYSITLHINKEVEQEWLDFMQQKHIDDVLKTGYFIACSMRKIVSDNDKKTTTYTIEYTTKSEADYIAYQYEFASTLQLDLKQRFEGKFTALRNFYEIVFNKKV